VKIGVSCAAEPALSMIFRNDHAGRPEPVGLEDGEDAWYASATVTF